MWQFTKYSFLDLLFIVISKIAIIELFNNKPFKFEKYRTEEELERAVKDAFPIGSDLDKSIKLLEKSGAECNVFDDKASYESVVNCEYTTDFISLNPLESYRVALVARLGHKKIIGLGTHRVSGLILITW